MRPPVGLTSEKFLNRFLEDFLVEELEYGDGSAEVCLGDFTFQEPTKS
jgi:hypothetical protein